VGGHTGEPSPGGDHLAGQQASRGKNERARVTTLLRLPTLLFANQTLETSVEAGAGRPGSGAQLPPAASQGRGPSLFGLVIPSLTRPLVLALWLLVAAAVLSLGIAVLFAGGFWARHRVLKI
jgi:hypothetical protein